MASKTALSRVEAVKAHLEKGEFDKLSEDLNRVHHLANEDAGLSYDDAFVSLCSYALLASSPKGRPAVFKAPPAPPSKLKPGLDIDFLLDAEIKPKKENPALIDEWLVADILDCIGSIQTVSPVPLKLRAMQVGCVQLGFRHELDASTILGSEPEARDSKLRTLKDFFRLDNEEWRDIVERYSIIEIQFTPGL